MNNIKVISGGQTGVDQAALQAALDRGFETGGWMPKGCKTLDGPNRNLLNKFHMKEHSSTSYKQRTWDNVLMADYTLRIATTFKSAGEKCTFKAIEAHKKPALDIPIIEGCPAFYPNDVARYIAYYCAADGILNVAGNSEQTSPGIYEIAYDFLDTVFYELTIL